ncbi:MAG: F0F1 ATP synthase subunit delta [Anaerolineae bacterium]|nr:F0F1 ATP synthase subunit delta [Anaerolineae bacterium]
MNPFEPNRQGDHQEAGGSSIGRARSDALEATIREWNDAPQRATVRVAEPLTSQERVRLQVALERYFRSPIQIEEEISPEILGGVWVRVGDTVIDGSIRGRLDTLSQHLCARCRVMVSGGLV